MRGHDFSKRLPTTMARTGYEPFRACGSTAVTRKRSSSLQWTRQVSPATHRWISECETGARHPPSQARQVASRERITRSATCESVARLVQGQTQRMRGSVGPIGRWKWYSSRTFWDNLRISRGTARRTVSSRMRSVSTSTIDCFHICLAPTCRQCVAFFK